MKFYFLNQILHISLCIYSLFFVCTCLIVCMWRVQQHTGVDSYWFQIGTQVCRRGSRNVYYWAILQAPWKSDNWERYNSNIRLNWRYIQSELNSLVNKYLRRLSCFPSWDNYFTVFKLINLSLINKLFSSETNKHQSVYLKGINVNIMPDCTREGGLNNTCIMSSFTFLGSLPDLWGGKLVNSLGGPWETECFLLLGIWLYCGEM